VWFQKTPFNFAGRIERPLCPKCQTRMMLARLTPGRSGFELQYFDCPKCDHELTIEVPEVDPLKKAEGWLSGELGHSPSPCHGAFAKSRASRRASPTSGK
jgi:hypothetical protein